MGPVSKAPRVMDASAPLSPPPFSTLQCRVALGLPSSAAPGFDTGTASAHDNVPSSLVGPEGGVWLTSAQPPPLLSKTPSVKRRQVMTMSWDKMKKKWLSAQFSQVFFFFYKGWVAHWCLQERSEQFPKQILISCLISCVSHFMDMERHRKDVTAIVY